MKILNKIGLIYCLLIIVACGWDRQAGSTTEATNGLYLVVRDQDGHLLQGVRVSTFESSTMQMRQSVFTDRFGVAYFKKDTVPLHLEVLNQDSSSMSWMALSALDSLSLTIEPSASLRISAKMTDSVLDNPNLVLKLENTPYEALIVDGVYQFNHLPQGSYLLTLNSMPITRINIEAGSALDTLLNLSQLEPSVMFDDFEDQDHLHLLSKQTGSLGWYFGGYDLSAWVLPTGSNDYKQAVEASEQGSSRALHLQFTIQEDSNYLLMGTYLGSNISHYDLSAMTSIHMRVRGNARFDVALEQSNEQSAGILRKSIWRDSAQLEWQEVVLRPDEVYLDSAWGHIPFVECADSIALFSIFLRSGTDLWIDEIWFEGVGAEQFQ